MDFLTFLDRRMTLFNYERVLDELQAEYMMKLAQLVATVGIDLVSAHVLQMTAPPAGVTEQAPSQAVPVSWHIQDQ